MRLRLPSHPSSTPLKLAWYFNARHAVEQRQFDRLTVAEVGRFRDLHRQISGSSIDALFRDWIGSGDRALPEMPSNPGPSAVHLEVRSLPYQYSQFGDLPGVC